jgi:AcrR family transcriptional regulator
LAAASKLFARFGLEKTTMVDISKASGKGKSSLYYYFESKEQVFAEVIKAEVIGLKATIKRSITNVDDPNVRFRVFFTSRSKYLNEKAHQYTSIRDEHLNNYSFIEDLTQEYSRWEVSTIAEILESGRKQGLFDLSNRGAASYAKAFHFALKSLEYPWIPDLTREEIEDNVNVLIDVLLRGIAINKEADQCIGSAR